MGQRDLVRVKNQRLSQEEISIIREQTNQGKSLNYLSKVLNVGKPTIYYQVRKFKPRIKKDFIVNLNDFQIGELIGAFAGDGNYHHPDYNSNFPNKPTKHRIRYFLTYSREKDYAEYLRNLLLGLNLNPNLNSRNKSVIILTVNSKEFINFIREYITWEKDKTFTIRLKKELASYSDGFLRGFARGLMDTDGFVNNSNVVCACISQGLIDNLSEIFGKFNLQTTRSILDRGGNTRPLHYVRVRSVSLNHYKENIGFSGEGKTNYLNASINKRISKN